MKRAIVVGGGIGGLTSAKILSDFYDEVTLLDPGSAAHGRHLHVLLLRGQLVLEKIFPGILEEFIGASCPEVDWSGDTVWEGEYGRFPRRKSGVRALSIGRSLLEETLRRRISVCRNVSVRKASFESLMTIGGRVTGVRTSDGESLAGELVLLSPGQHFPIQRSLGSALKVVRTMDLDLTYETAVFNSADLALGDLKQYYYQLGFSGAGVGGVICPIGRGQHVATLIHRGCPEQGTGDFEAFLKCAEEIPSGTFRKIIGAARPLGDISVFRKRSVFRRELAPEMMPQGLFLLGDVLCSLNPVFGQGMTVTLLQAELLLATLQSGRLDSREYHEGCQRLIDGPFRLSVIGGGGYRALGPLFSSLLLAFHLIPKFHEAFLRRLHLLHLHRSSP